MKPSRLFAVLCLALTTCVGVVSPEDANVEVVVKNVPAGAASLLVELTEGATGTIVDKHPVPSTSDVHVFFANVPAGPIQVLAQAFDPHQAVLASADPIHDVATQARKTFVASLRTGPPPCVQYDRDGFACPQHFATLPFLASRLVPLGTSAAPRMLVVSSDAAPSVALVTGDDPPVTVATGALSSGIVVSADRMTALVPGSPSADEVPTYALGLVRVGQTPPVTRLGARVLPGDYGLLQDGTVWAIDAVGADGMGELVLVPPNAMTPIDLGNDPGEVDGDDAGSTVDDGGAGDVDAGDADAGDVDAGDVDAGDELDGSTPDDADAGTTDDADGGTTDDAGTPPPPPPPCSGAMRGPVALSADGATAVFESRVSRLVTVGPGGRCTAVTLPDGFDGLPGSWTATPDLAQVAAAVAPPTGYSGAIGLFTQGTNGVVTTPLEYQDGDSSSASFPFVDGATAVLPDGTVFVSIASGGSGGILAIDTTGHATKVAQVHPVTRFDVRVPDGGAPVVTALTADGTIAMRPAGGDSFVASSQRLDWASRLVGPDGSMLAWELPAPNLTPSAWYFDATRAAPPVRLQHPSQRGDARVWMHGGQPVLVYAGSSATGGSDATATALYDARSDIQPLVSARAGLAWDAGASGLVYVQPGGASAPYLLPARGGAPLALSSSGAVAVAVGDSGLFWVAFANGELARVGLPQGATP